MERNMESSNSTSEDKVRFCIRWIIMEMEHFFNFGNGVQDVSILERILFNY